MPKTKNQGNGRGRPTKGFNLVKEKKLQDEANKATTGRGRPKKVRKIDDSVNTKIDIQRKSVAQLEKANKEIERNLGDCKLTSRNYQKTEFNTGTSGISNDKRADNFSLIVLICAMLFFIFALGKTFLYKTTMAEIKIHELINAQNTIQESEIGEGNEYTEGEDNNEVINEEQMGAESNNDDNNAGVNEETIDNSLSSDIQSNDYTMIYNFYNHINNLDYNDINASVDKYLKNSDVFRTYFTQNWLSRFREKINSNGVSINNINRVSGDENSTRYYSYTVHYELAESGESYDEDWELAIVNRNGEYLIGSIRCVTTGCSKMPFFQK